jgi:hypothetical protein
MCHERESTRTHTVESDKEPRKIKGYSGNEKVLQDGGGEL